MSTAAGIANLATYLTTPGASFITGSVQMIYGGYSTL